MKWYTLKQLKIKMKSSSKNTNLSQGYFNTYKRQGGKLSLNQILYGKISKKSKLKS